MNRSLAAARDAAILWGCVGVIVAGIVLVACLDGLLTMLAQSAGVE